MKVKPHFLELLWAALCFLGLVFFWRRILFVGDVTFPHDNLYWHYPIFRFFAENLLRGELPLWNAYSHGGEPFYPLLFQIRLLDPSAILPVFLGSLFTKSLPILFHWTRLFQTLLMLAGIYLVLRPVAEKLLTRLCLLSILFFTGFVLNPCRQDGILCLFLWVPFVEYFAAKIFLDGKSNGKNWMALTLFTGLHFQSYFFAGPFLWLFFGMVGILIFERKAIQVLVKSWKQVTFSLVLLGLFALPNLYLYLNQAKFVFPLRMIPQEVAASQPKGGPIPLEAKPSDETVGLALSYDFVLQTGGKANPVDFLQSVLPRSNSNIFADHEAAWGEPSEAILYLGILPWVLCLYGLFCGRGPHKTIWMTQFVLFGLLLLGSNGGLHRVLFAFFPPLWFIRNMDLLAPFFLFCALYFCILGLNAWLSGQRNRKGEIFFWIMVSVQFVAVFWGTPMKKEALCLWGFALLLPLVYGQTLSRRPLIALLCITTEVIFHFSRASFSYAEVPTIEKTLASTKQVSPLVLEGDTGILSPREIVADYPLNSFRQTPRYLELFYHQPVVFSALFHSPALPSKGGTSSFDTARNFYRWNSAHLLRNYFELIHSDITSDELEKRFLVGKPPFAWQQEDSSLRLLETEMSAKHFQKIELNFNSPGGTLYWASIFDPSGWIVKANGVSLQLDYTPYFTKFYLPSGNVHLELAYRPPVLIAVLVVYYAAIVFCFVTYLLPRRLSGRFA